MSTVLKIHKQTTMPGTPEAHAIYIIAPPANPDFVEIYVTDSTGAAKRVIDETRVEEMIDAAVAGAENLIYAADIAARDALVLTANAKVYVADASADSTVDSGGATYFYRHATATFIKTSEDESMDVTVAWADITGRPTSAVADIDNAVSLRHSHTNKTHLDKIDESGGNMTYDGSLPKTGWASTGW